MDRLYLELLKEQFKPNKGDNDIHAEIIKFLMKNPRPKDSEIHAFAENMGMDHEKLEEHVYMILGNVLSGGKSRNFKGRYDPEQLRKGTKVEMEHVSEPLIAEKIAKDHLAEIPDYYDRLEKMETAAGVRHEIFTQTPSYSALPRGKNKDIQMLRTAIIAEFDAANLYEQMAHDAQDDDVRDVMMDVANEEKQHVGEFEFLLEHLDEDFERYEDKGEEEAEEMTGKGEPPEPEPVEDEEEPTEEG